MWIGDVASLFLNCGSRFGEW